jgi:DNA polymerase-3 subunit alpha
VHFFAGSMTYEMASTDKLADFVGDAARMGIRILPPDINQSGVYFGVEGNAVRYALAAVKNVGAAAMQAVVDERAKNGPYKDIHDFVSRVDANLINRRALEHLIMAGCFDTLHSNRRQLFESIDMLVGTAQAATQDRHSNQISLFGGESAPSQHKQLKPTDEWPIIERLNHERAAIGFYLSSHPLSAYQSLLKKLGVSPTTRASETLKDRQALKLAGVVIAARIRTGPRGRSAFVTLSDAHGQCEVTIFDEVVLNQAHALLNAGALVYLEVEARNSERGQRLLVKKLDKLDDQVNRVRTSLLTVTVRHSDALPELKALLGAPKERGTRVELMVETPAGLVKLQLAGAYDVAPQRMLDFENLKGLQAMAA